MKVDEEGGTEEQERQRGLKESFQRRRPPRRRRRRTGEGRRRRGRACRRTASSAVVDAAPAVAVLRVDDGVGVGSAGEGVQPQGVTSAHERRKGGHLFAAGERECLSRKRGVFR